MSAPLREALARWALCTESNVRGLKEAALWSLGRDYYAVQANKEHTVPPTGSGKSCGHTPGIALRRQPLTGLHWDLHPLSQLQQRRRPHIISCHPIVFEKIYTLPAFKGGFSLQLSQGGPSKPSLSKLTPSFSSFWSLLISPPYLGSHDTK